jgi:hypothetical protein
VVVVVQMVRMQAGKILPVVAVAELLAVALQVLAVARTARAAIRSLIQSQ